ncbi:DUF2637 domain-containing protein [Streptomyces fagopyri]|uniref:DUF2637 domain-containing protein n=1 Tax=Streptomyces fagopyri TaxID=2662397 RepID=UPI0038242D95
MQSIFTFLGGLVLAAIGFTGSYQSLRRLGQAHGLGQFAYVFPVGVDVGIVVLYAMDLYLTRRRIHWPVVRFTAHLFTAATIIFNAASGTRPWRQDLIGAGIHAVIPVMFVITVEAARRVVIKITRLEDGKTDQDRTSVPIRRWLLNPIGSFLMWRRMVIHALASYAEAVDRHRDLLVYRTLLERDYPKGKWPRTRWWEKGWKRAPMEARLPLLLAPLGVTVDEALAIPEQLRAEERRRAKEDERRQLAEQREHEDQLKVDELRAINDRADIAEAEQAANTRVTLATVANRSASSQASAVADVQERTAVREAEALESATTAEALLREAQAREQAATVSESAAAAEQRAADLRARTARDDAETARLLAEKQQRLAQAAEAEKRTVEAKAAAVEMATRAAETEHHGTNEQLATQQKAHAIQEAAERTAQAEQRAAEARQAAAETDRRAAEALEAAAETRRNAALMEREAAAATRAAEEHKAAAETARLDAAETARRAAETELRAVEAEDEARLKPTERDARRVARMIITAGGAPEAVELEQIATVLGVALSTASERRREAGLLLAAGYQLPAAADCLN